MNCNVCDLSNSKNWIKKYKYWNLFVCPYQHTLGSLIAVNKRHIEDFREIRTEEFSELKKVIDEAEDLLGVVFKPDWYNVQQNGNWEHHLHFNIIPRYKEKRRFEGNDYFDQNFGHPVSYTSELLNNEVYLKLTNKFKNLKIKKQ